MVPKSSTPEDPRPEVVQLRYKPEVKPSSSPPKIAETKPTIASDKPNIPLKPSQIREEGTIYSNVNSSGYLVNFQGFEGKFVSINIRIVRSNIQGTKM